MIKRHPVLIHEVRPTKNGTHQLMLTQVVERELNATQFFMQGHPKFLDPKARVAFQTVSAQQMEKYNFEKGQNLDEVLGIHFNIEVIEGFKPFGKTRDIVSGELVDQKPKINPITQIVMKKDGKPIFRTTNLIKGQANDVLIIHDNPLLDDEVIPAKKKDEVLAN